jgi:hypothetical protein
MERHHPTAGTQPIEQYSDIAVADQYFRMFFYVIAQESESLNRSEAAASAENRRNVATPEKTRQITGPAGGLTGEVSFAIKNSLGEFHCVALSFDRGNPSQKRFTVNATGRRNDADARPGYEPRWFMHSQSSFPPPKSC